MYKDMKSWIGELLSAKEKHAMPIVTYPALTLNGNKVIDLVTEGEEQAKCIIALSNHFTSSAGVMVMDLSVEAEAFGAPVTINENEVPTVSSRIVYDSDTIDNLKIPFPGDYRTGEFLKAATIASRNITDRPVFGGMIGPYSLAGRLFDITEMMTYILLEPVNARLLVTKCTEFLIEYARAYKKTGANGLIIAEPAAGLLYPEACQEFSSDFVKKIVEAVQDDDFTVVLHNCGNTLHLVDSMVSTGAHALHFGNTVDILEILPQVPSHLIVSGNIDPVSILKMATPEIIFEKTLALLEKTKDYPNFLLSTGCDVPPGTPMENVAAFYKALHKYNDKL
ncbi:MAG: methylcobamide--CoM methyltransferase [Bacteroidales bacterium]|nr:methylcobamide--CoM methyltransferase [Bacteroidales bacterium]